MGKAHKGTSIMFTVVLYVREKIASMRQKGRKIKCEKNGYVKYWQEQQL